MTLMLVAVAVLVTVVITRMLTRQDADWKLRTNTALLRAQLATAVERADEFEKKYKLAHTDVFRMWAVTERAHKECEAVRLAYLPFPGANMPAREREALKWAEDQHNRARMMAGLPPVTLRS